MFDLLENGILIKNFDSVSIIVEFVMDMVSCERIGEIDDNGYFLVIKENIIQYCEKYDKVYQGYIMSTVTKETRVVREFTIEKNVGRHLKCGEILEYDLKKIAGKVIIVLGEKGMKDDLLNKIAGPEAFYVKNELDMSRIENAKCVVFDDCLINTKIWKPESKIYEIICSGSKTVILSMHFPLSLPPIVRKFVKVVFMMKNDCDTTISRYYDLYGFWSLSLSDFKKTCGLTWPNILVSDIESGYHLIDLDDMFVIV